MSMDALVVFSVCVMCCVLFVCVSAQEFMRMVLPKDLKYKISCYS
jgi:hypothetical protein